MNNYLLNHAIQKVWCSPKQDNQYIFQLKRITPNEGVTYSYNLFWEEPNLPDKNNRYHVYLIGKYTPSLLNFFAKETDLPFNTWTKISDSCNILKDTLIDIYTDSGMQIPKTETYYLISENKGILIAVKKNTKLSYNFNNDNIYIRTYRNAYFSSIQSQPNNDYIYIGGATVNNTQDILNIQNEVISKRLLGNVNCYINGKYTNDINIINTVSGDVVEYVFDSSVKLVKDFLLTDLRSFSSTKDNKIKYILHYEGYNNIIDYQDDIDLYMYNTQSNKGVYIHKNDKATLRNLTHKDYSLLTDYITTHLDFLKENGIISESNVKIKMFIKKSGFNRPLILEKSRINELYKLPDNLILNTLSGLDSNLNIWKAVNLENSNYIKLMEIPFIDLTNELVVDTYGYNSVAKLIADTPKVTTTSGANKIVPLPELYKVNSTFYEYDIDGKLLGWRHHQSGLDYVCINNTTEYVQIFSGIGGNILDEKYNTNITIDPDLNYRFYSCDLDNNLPTYEWEDTTNSNEYSIINNQLTWQNGRFNLVRSDKKFLALDVSLDYQEGVIEFPIIHLQDRDNTTPINMEIDLSLGELSLYLNGQFLIRDLDYFYDNPRIVIINKSYLNQNGLQNIHIRFTGFCNEDLSIRKNYKYGFIFRDRVSDDHIYDIKDGNVQHMFIDGKVILPTAIPYYEDSNSGNTFSNLNGKPYIIENVTIPLKKYTNEETYSYQNESVNIDNSISGYMTDKISQVNPNILNVTNSKHYLYSPFLSRVLNEILDDHIVFDPLKIKDDNYVRGLVQPYEYLLNYDTIHPSRQYSKDYVIVHPHPYNYSVDISVQKYQLFAKIHQLYAKDIVNISSHLNLI